MPRHAAAPYAIAFSIEELLLARSWAAQRGLLLSIATDQVVDGAEFEELLIIAPPGRERRTLTLWRTGTAVYAQTPRGRPRMFGSLRALLDSLLPARPARAAGWMRRLGLAPLGPAGHG